MNLDRIIAGAMRFYGYFTVVAPHIALSVIAAMLIMGFGQAAKKRIALAFVATIAVIGIVFRIFSGEINQWSNERQALNRLSELCALSDERIEEIHGNVWGVLALRPPSHLSSQRLHEAETKDNWVRMPWRRYQFFETNSPRKDAPARFERYRMHTDWGKQEFITTPTANIGFTWRRISERHDAALGIHGDETIVFDVASRKEIARRRAYFFERRMGSPDDARSRVFCPNTSIGETVSFAGGTRPFPNDSYDFVSRVALPPPVSPQEIRAYFQIYPGMGRERSRHCWFPLVPADQLSREDVLLEKNKQWGDLIIKIRGEDGEHICPGYFAAMKPMTVFGNDVLIRFADGTRIHHTEAASLAKERGS